MYRGTTPTLTFRLPFDANSISELYITIVQKFTDKGFPFEINLEKRLSNCIIDGNLVSIKLTQAETLRFNDKYNCQIQMRIKIRNSATQVDEIVASKIVTVPIDAILKDGEI